jgi:hypothetical protein
LWRKLERLGLGWYGISLASASSLGTIAAYDGVETKVNRKLSMMGAELVVSGNRAAALSASECGGAKPACVHTPILPRVLARERLANGSAAAAVRAARAALLW